MEKFLRLHTRVSRQTVEILALYIVIGAGGLWHLLGVLQTAMTVLSTPVIIVLAALIVWAYHREMSSRTAEHQRARRRFFVWAAVVFVLGFSVEFVGVQTGIIFGAYTYETAPLPALMPLAIGSAWLGMMLAASAVAQRVAERMGVLDSTPNDVHPNSIHPNSVQAQQAQSDDRQGGRQRIGQRWLAIITVALLIAMLMAMFDVFMEPAAVSLRYWAWLELRPFPFVAPFQNYTAWFGISFAFASVGLYTRALPMFGQRLPTFAFHAYWAQLLYFTLVNCRP
jgi:putative membrane protein